MRSDNLFYALAVVFFLIAVISMIVIADETQRTLWTIIDVVLGLVSAGLGYYQRPKPKMTEATPSEVQPTELGDSHIKESHLAESVEKHYEPSTPTITTTSVPMEMPAPMPVLAPEQKPPILPAPAEMPALEATGQVPAESELLRIIGINEKRAAQLNTVGINTIADLANASAEDLAKNLTISPKITRMWIGSAKKLQKQTE